MLREGHRRIESATRDAWPEMSAAAQCRDAGPPPSGIEYGLSRSTRIAGRSPAGHARIIEESPCYKKRFIAFVLSPGRLFSSHRTPPPKRLRALTRLPYERIPAPTA